MFPFMIAISVWVVIVIFPSNADSTVPNEHNLWSNLAPRVHQDYSKLQPD